MKALVTGASGFVGSAVVRTLLRNGIEVRAMVRSGSNLDNLNDLDVEIVTGDLCDKDSLPVCCTGCNALYHVAADYRLWVPDPATMYQTNVEGSRNIILAAANAGAEKIVYTSSVATLGLHKDGSPSDENTPSSVDNMIGHYKRSKFLAEQTVNELVHSQGLPITIVNPSTPIGPGDIRPTPTGRIIRDAVNGAIPAYVDTGLNIVHVDDVAQGHLLAYQSGAIGERYILGGENLTLNELLSNIAKLTGQKPPSIKLPHSFVLPIAYLMEILAHLTSIEPRATLDAVRMSKYKMFFSSNKAEQQLGYRARPADEAIKDAVEWFKNR